MTLYFIILVAGLAALMWSADKFVDSAGSLSYKLGMSPLLVGMTIVAMGTSAPEAVVSISASLNGSAEMVIGTVLGSNIANIALVLGATAIIAPLPVRFGIVKKELPLMLAATGLAGYALANNHLGLFDAFAMLAMLGFTLWWLFRSDENDPIEVPETPRISLKASVVWVIIAILILAGSAHALVWSASSIAYAFGISELVVGLTIVAVGTSLPELAASLAGALKRQHDIAIGNVIGSNMFNILLVLAIPGLLSPGETPALVESRDYPILIGLSLAFALILIWKRRETIPRWVGAVLLGGYLGYLALLFTSGA